MRTWSPSRRWLTNCDVPVRRRSTSCCRSASVSASPGGQPSTMHPSAGPWLSPKVVTQKSLPMVLPDMLRFACLLSLERCAREQENPASPAPELQPYERQLWPGAPNRLLGVAHLHDEHPAWIQVPRRLTQDDAHRVEPVATGGKRKLRLVPVFRGQAMQLGFSYVGR